MAQGREASGMTIPRLSLTERLAIQGYAARAAWPAGFQIYERGVSADGLFVVVRGRVVLRSRVRAGRGFVPWVATPGETFGAEGLSPNAVYATDARTDAETETLFLSSGKLRAFIREQPASAMAVIGQVMAERTALLEKLRELTTLSVEQRLIAALRRMSAHDSFTRDDGFIELCAARYRLLCEVVGATRESVSLVFARLVGEGLVERRGGTLYVMPSARLFDRLADSGVADDALLAAVLADVDAVPALQ